jgi:hypothetical protein
MMNDSLGVNFNFGRAHWSAEAFLKFQERLAALAGVNWEILQTHKQDGTCPPPPYKEPLAYILYANESTAEIPWRQCEKIATRLCVVIGPWPAEDDDRVQALFLVVGLNEAVRKHRPIEFR